MTKKKFLHAYLALSATVTAYRDRVALVEHGPPGPGPPSPWPASAA